MNKKTKNLIAVVVMTITLFLLTGLLVLKVNEEQKELSTAISTTQDLKSNQENHFEITDELEDYIFSTLEQASSSLTTPTPNSTIAPNEENFAIATITIQTDRKTKTYDVMPDVVEKTLKKNIGHLPSSSWFGEDGLCVLMGHRDTDFSILQFVKIGDVITIKSNNKIFRYYVKEISIIEDDNELSFKVSSESCLVLVTCYPFKYSGHAPNKYIVNCCMP